MAFLFLAGLGRWPLYDVELERVAREWCRRDNN
jgi:hypothetical protein